MKDSRQKGSATFIVIVIIGLFLATQFDMKALFESEQFKSNIAYVKSLFGGVFSTLVVQPTLNSLKDKAGGIGFDQQMVDDLNQGKIPEGFKARTNSMDSIPMDFNSGPNYVER
jgi:hypothetical protein